MSALSKREYIYQIFIFADYSDEEMTMAHDDEILEDSKDADDHEMSIVDDNNSSNNRTEKEWHINLFGEIVHDQPEDHEMKIGENSFKSSLRIPLKCPLNVGLVPNKTASCWIEYYPQF